MRFFHLITELILGKFMKKTLLLHVLLLSFSLLPFSALAADGDVHEYQLKNGLKVIVKEDHRAPVAIAEVWYKVGSSYEIQGVTGISHALEHMMFRGSKNYSSEKMTQIIAENGIQQNAFTYFDYTGYYEMAGKNKLPIIFQLEADRMRDLSLRGQDFSKEIQIVMEERRMRTDDNPQQLTFERFLAAANTATPYHHPVIGWMSDLQNMTIDDLRQWYNKWYAPNNAILVVVGDVNPADIYQLAEKYFANFQPSDLPKLKPQPEIKSLGLRTVEVKVPAKLPYLAMGYNVPAARTATLKWEPYALSVLKGVLAGGDSSRLQQDLVRGKQLASEINVDYQPYFRLDNLLYIEAIPTPGHTTQQLKDAILDEITQLQNKPVTLAELERTKAQIIANHVYIMDSIANQANQIGMLESVGLSWHEADNFITQIKAITPEQVQAVTKKYLTPDNLTIAILKPLPMEKGQKVPTDLGGASYVH